MSSFNDSPSSWPSLLEALPDGTALMDRDGVIHFVNELLGELTGYSREELVGQSVEMLVPPRLRNMKGEARLEYRRDPNRRIIWSGRDLTVLRKDGSELPVDFALSSLTLDGRHWTIGSIRDSGAQRVAERARTVAERHFRLAFEDNMAPMVFADIDNRITAANAAFCQMVGRSSDEMIGSGSEPFTHPEDLNIANEFHDGMLRGEVDQMRYVKRFLHTDGRVIIAEVSKSAARDEDGSLQYFIVSARDITDERALTAQLSHQALHDPLTGLANRALFEDRLLHARARVARQDGMSALILLDLDDFKGVNDTYGHLVGDQLLAEVASRLEGVTRSSDTLCRFGGDEFLYLAEDVTSTSEAERVAQRLLRTLDQPFEIAGLSLGQHASLGVAVWDSASPEELDVVRDADMALYEAKRLGKGRHAVYSSGMHQQALSRLSLAEQLRHAIPSHELAMHFQPIVDLTSTQVVGFEALMRWRHPERGWVPPNVFIPLAEQSDLILELGQLALHEALDAASSWQQATSSNAPPFVTVNLSARQFHDPGLTALVERELAASGLGANRLIVEITEGVALLEIGDTLSVIQHLSSIGVGVALDNFGTGFSSLSHLSQLNPRMIKIDQSFVRPTRASLHNERLLETIVSIGRNLEMDTLAEGIETQAQLGQLRELRCSLGQGFLFSPAVPYEETNELVGRIFQS